MTWIATKPIDFPLGSGVLAFAPGDEVPDSHVKSYGYDKVSKDDGGPLVAKAGTKAAEHAADAVIDTPGVPRVEDQSVKGK